MGLGWAALGAEALYAYFMELPGLPDFQRLVHRFPGI
jgi:hypothetical protein